MGTFDASSKVKRATADPRTDHKLPHPASLSWETVTGESALAGTTGHHCELVHGDHWRQIKGNVMENVQEDVTTSITGNHSHTVSGNQNTSIIGDAQMMHVGTCSKTYVDNKIETYSKHRFKSISSNSEYTYTDAAYQAFGFKFQVCLFQLQFNGWTMNFVTSPMLALIATAGSKAVPGPAPSSAGTQPTDDSRGTVGALGLAGAAAGLPVAFAPLSITGNLGLNVSMDVLNLSTTAILKVTGVTVDAKLKGLEGWLGAAAAHAGLGLAKVLPRVGVPPHPPLTG